MNEKGRQSAPLHYLHEVLGGVGNPSFVEWITKTLNLESCSDWSSSTLIWVSGETSSGQRRTVTIGITHYDDTFMRVCVTLSSVEGELISSMLDLDKPKLIKKSRLEYLLKTLIEKSLVGKSFNNTPFAYYSNGGEG